jgi:hypothetical protein
MPKNISGAFLKLLVFFFVTKRESILLYSIDTRKQHAFAALIPTLWVLEH